MQPSGFYSPIKPADKEFLVSSSLSAKPDTVAMAVSPAVPRPALCRNGLIVRWVRPAILVVPDLALFNKLHSGRFFATAIVCYTGGADRHHGAVRRRRFLANNLSPLPSAPWGLLADFAPHKYLRLVCASSLAATLIPSTSGNRPPDHGTESEDDDNRLARIMRFLGHFASFPEAARHNHTPSRQHAIKPLKTTPRTIRRCLPRPDFLTPCCLSGCWSLCCSTRASKPSSPSSRSSPRLSRRSVLRSQATRGLSTLTPVSYSQVSFVACYDVKMIEC